MSDQTGIVVGQILDAIYSAERVPNHKLVVKMSRKTWARVRIEAQPHLTGMVRYPEARIAGCEILLDEWADEERWELLSVEPARYSTARVRKEGRMTILTPEHIKRLTTGDVYDCVDVYSIGGDDSNGEMIQASDLFDTLAAYAEIVQKVAESELDGLSLAHGIESRYLPDDVYLCARKLRGMEVTK